MLTATTGYSTTQSTTTNESIRKQQNTHIFILRLHDGRLAIGQASNVGRRTASINSGLHPSLPKSLMVKEVLGVKPITQTRTYVSTVRHFCDTVGADNVVAV